MLNVIEPTSEMAVVVVGAGTVGLAAIVSFMIFQFTSRATLPPFTVGVFSYSTTSTVSKCVAAGSASAWNFGLCCNDNNS